MGENSKMKKHLTIILSIVVVAVLLISFVAMSSTPEKVFEKRKEAVEPILNPIVEDAKLECLQLLEREGIEVKDSFFASGYMQGEKYVELVVLTEKEVVNYSVECDVLFNIIHSEEDEPTATIPSNYYLEDGKIVIK